jgi:hypothetical protein
MSNDLETTAGSLRKELYEPPLLTRHQPLLNVTGKSKDALGEVLVVKSFANPIKTAADAPPVKTTDANNKNGSPEKGNKSETEKSAAKDALDGKSGQ